MLFLIILLLFVIITIIFLALLLFPCMHIILYVKLDFIVAFALFLHLLVFHIFLCYFSICCYRSTLSPSFSLKTSHVLDWKS
jgi:hypothetical protein